MSDANPHAHHRARVRQRYKDHGLRAFAEHEALELLLYYCYPRRDTNEIAHRMINAFGSLHNLMDANVKDIMSRCEVSENVAVLVNLVPSLAGLYMRRKWSGRTVLDSAQKAGAFAMSLYVDATVENAYLISMGAQHQVNYVSLIATGTVNEAAIHPRIIADEALRHQAVGVIVTHNHPGGTNRPSRQDLEVTRMMAEGLEYIKIAVIDHIIVAGNQYYSFADRRQHVKGY